MVSEICLFIPGWNPIFCSIIVFYMLIFSIIMKKDNMVNKYKVVDNFLPLKVFLKKYRILSLLKYSYYYKLGTASPDSNDLYHFVHYFYQDNSVCSHFFKQVLTPIISNFTYYSLIRAKANCYPSTETQFTHALHTDYQCHTKV